MFLIDPKTITIDPKRLETLKDIRQATHRRLIFSPRPVSFTLFDRFLSTFMGLGDIMAIKNAQQEAQDEQEATDYLSNLRRAFTTVVEAITDDWRFQTQGDLFFLFRTISPEAHLKSPNQYRRHEITIGKHGLPAPAQLPSIMELLFEYLMEIRDPVIRAVYLHHELVRIHPFMDGNGRVARMAKNWILMYELYPPVFIRDVRDRDRYIRTLELSFTELDDNPTIYNPHTRDFFNQELDRLTRSLNILKRDVDKEVHPNEPAQVDTTRDH